MPDGDFKNFLSPVIRLSRLTDDELFALISKLYSIHALYHKHNLPVSDEDKLAFLKLYGERMGADSLLTPREVIRDFLTVLNIMLQNPGLSFAEIVRDRSVQSGDENGGEVADAFDEEFGEFEL